MPAVANIGVRPTFGGVHTRLEMHIPRFSQELYGEKMQVFFLKYLGRNKSLPHRIRSGADTIGHRRGAFSLEIPVKTRV